MRGLSRAASTLLAAGVAGFLLWLAAQMGRHSTGSYWAAYGIVAGAGLVVGLSQLRGRDGSPRAMFLFAFLPVLVVAGWVLLGMQPHGNWFRDHVLSWSGEMNIRGVVDDLGTWIGALAFGMGLVFGFTLEPATMRRRAVVAPAAPVATHDVRATDEPVTAERHEVGDTSVVRTSAAETRTPPAPPGAMAPPNAAAPANTMAAADTVEQEAAPRV